MIGTYLFDKALEYKEKLKTFFTQKKKLQALQNYSEVAPFPHKKHLVLIKRCMDEGFLDNETDGFIGHLLNKYEVNFLDWSHRTKWLKGEMCRIAADNGVIKPQQTYFNFVESSKNRETNVPLEILAKVRAQQQISRRI